MKPNKLYTVVRLDNTVDPYPTRQELVNKFQKQIEEYYNIYDHVVDFENIHRCSYSNEFVLEYEFRAESPVNSPYNIIKNLAEHDYYYGYVPVVDKVSTIKNPTKSYTDLNDLYLVYTQQMADETVRKDKECWDFAKFYLIKKIKRLLNGDKDGGYWEVEEIKYSLNKLDQFNKPKKKFVESHLNKVGKTLINFNIACDMWDRQNKEDLSHVKMSAECKADLAVFGYTIKFP